MSTSLHSHQASVLVKGSFSCESVHGFEQGFAYYLATPTLLEFLGSQAQEDTLYLLHLPFA
jgi:hypothetical protein